MRETWVWSFGREDPLKKEMVIHSSILAWRIPWMEKHGRLQSMGSQRVRHDWATSLHFTFSSYASIPHVLIEFHWRQAFFFNWRVIALQYCVGFCHTRRWISYKYTHVLSLLNLPSGPLPPHPTPLGCHRAPGWAPCACTAASHWRAVLHMVVSICQCCLNRVK